MRKLIKNLIKKITIHPKKKHLLLIKISGKISFTQQTYIFKLKYTTISYINFTIHYNLSNVKKASKRVFFVFLMLFTSIIKLNQA